jgi:hypothetical protein
MVQNAGFGIERREDPASAWSSIGAVPGVGVSETVQLYGFDDDSPPPMTPSGDADYRLRQVNFDGSVLFTAPVTVPVPEPEPTLGLLTGLGALTALARRRGLRPLR